MNRRLAWALVLVVGCEEQSPGADTDPIAPTGDASTGCDETSDCSPLPSHPDATEDPAPSDFEGEVVPFLRGRVCTVHEVQAGAAIPVHLSPCLHPCLDLQSFQFTHGWDCVGSDCEGYALMWVIADGMACPTDAFGSFDASMCEYPEQPAEFTLTVSDDAGGPREGELRLEIPFVSNDDAAMIAADTSNVNLRAALIGKFAPDDARVPGMMNISLQPDHAAPPSSCGENGEACNCFEIGF